MERTLRMWEDKPEYNQQTLEQLEQNVRDADAARKYFWCEHCGAEKGEPCRGDVDEPLTERERQWHEEWDAHTARVDRWTGATELERAMLRAADDEA